MSRKNFMRRGIAYWPDLENNVAECVQEQRQDCNNGTRNMIMAYALKCVRANPEQSKEFKPTIGWCSLPRMTSVTILQDFKYITE
jgi:hypothetical protein